MAGRQRLPPENCRDQYVNSNPSGNYVQENQLNASSCPMVAGKVTLRSDNDPPPGYDSQKLREWQAIENETLLLQLKGKLGLLESCSELSLDEAQLSHSGAVHAGISSGVRPPIDSGEQFQQLAAWDANKRIAAIQDINRIPTYGDQSQQIPGAVSHHVRPVSDLDARQKSKKHKHLKCPIPGCGRTKDFRGRWEVKRHIKDLHPEQPEVGDLHLYRCAVLRCDHHHKVWRRLDKFRDHVRLRHPDLDLASHIQA